MVFPWPARCRTARGSGSVVEHHLAKVRVAGSNPVFRSEYTLLVEWPRGEAAACKAVYTGSNPVSTSTQVRGPFGIR